MYRQAPNNFFAWISWNWRYYPQWRKFTYVLLGIFLAMEIGIQIFDNAIGIPWTFLSVLVFYLFIVTPLAYTQRNNP